MKINIFDTKTHELLELINRYPSPHNGQPMRISFVDADTLDIFFQKERGLQSSDISFIFSFVSIGVFVEHVKSVARALGHHIDVTVALPNVTSMRGEGLLHCAQAKITWDTAARNEAELHAIQFRQTSRKKYHQGLTPEQVIALNKLVPTEMQLSKLSASQAQQAIWLNQRAVFDDMFDEPVRIELDHWLRYSQAQKLATKDGLAYDCMELNGATMRFIVHHPSVLRMPGLRGITQRYYTRTMRDNSDVLYMLAPFATEQQAYTVGVVIEKLWLAIAAQGNYLHPFGTIMSNHAAHQDFLKLAGVSDESPDTKYLVFIFRAGKSQPPVPSLRLPYDEHLVMQESV